MNEILIIDDDPWFLNSITPILEKNGYRTLTAKNGGDALHVLESSQPDLILLDVVMNDFDGFYICKKIKIKPNLKNIPIIFVTSSDDRDIIRKCFQVGGSDYVGKPIREYELLARIGIQLDVKKQHKVIQEMQTENISLKKHLLSENLDNPGAFSSIITVSPKMRSIFRYLESVASSSRPVLITGETGVGKEMVARIIYQLSNRPGDFITVNVAGLDDNMFSDTLFGHDKGAFTGAEKVRRGLIEKAAGGVLFLDEIGDLKPESQVKLLRMLQENEYYPIGSDERKFTDARIVVATNHDLYELTKSGKFREDLYYRLKTHQVHIPPLRERKEDIPILIKYFINEASAELNREPSEIPDNLFMVLEQYDFPGNIRELESMIFDTVSRSTPGTLSLECLRKIGPPDIDWESTNSSDGPRPVNLEYLRESFESHFPTLREISDFLIDSALERTDGNQTAAADLLGLSRQALNKRLKRAPK